MKAKILLVCPSPAAEDNKWPLTSPSAHLFHELLQRVCKIDTQKDTFVTALVNCSVNRDRLPLGCVRDCGRSFKLAFQDVQFQVVVALGMQVARHLITEGSTPPSTLLGTSVNVRRDAGVVPVFVFDDPEMMIVDYRQTDFRGNPTSASYWHERFVKQAHNFKSLLKRRGIA